MHPAALLTPDEAAEADRLAIAAGLTIESLMQNAGRAVARAVVARFRPCRTLVLCGPGSNGGDGYVAARLLAARGWPVDVAATRAPRRGSPAGAAASGWRRPLLPFGSRTARRAELVIDAVFGAGLSRDLDPVVSETLGACRRLVAVDVPSGLDGASGAARGYAPTALLTVTFVRRKPGHLLLPGRALCGETLCADIGLPDAVLAGLTPRCFHNGPGLWALRRLTASDHKYTRGTVTVCGGATMTGAARLAAGAARRAGAGLVTIAAERGAELYRSGEPGLIVDADPLATLLEDRRRQVWVCGPGLGQEAARRILPALLAAGRTVVLDADGLTAQAGRLAALQGVAVMTPHAGEFARLFGDPGTNRLAAARAAAAQTGSVVVLKGSDTIIAAPDGRAAINDNAPPWLGTAGSGDVLSGIVAGMLGQGLPPFEAAGAAVWLHGQAGRIAGEGLIAEDLLAALAPAQAKARGFAPGPR